MFDSLDLIKQLIEWIHKLTICCNDTLWMHNEDEYSTWKKERKIINLFISQLYSHLYS